MPAGLKRQRQRTTPLRLQELTAHNATGAPPKRLSALEGTRHEDFCHTRPCGFLHPGRGCNANMAVFLPRAYARALPVYLPVYFLPALLVHRRRLLDAKAGPKILGKVRRLPSRALDFFSFSYIYFFG